MNFNFKFNLSNLVIIGMVLGIIAGLSFGEDCSKLSVVGDIYVILLLMCVLPYIVVTLIYSIGRLNMNEAKLITVKGGFITLLFWSIAIFFVLLMPLTFPKWQPAKFFSSSLIETPPHINYLKLYLTDNPFHAMANGLVPAVVLFCICVGTALITLPEKEILIKDMELFGKALEKVTAQTVKLAPIGTFAITAVAAGSMSIEQIGRIQVYFITFIAAALLMTFCIFPLIITTFTPYKYKELFVISKETLIIAFTTSNLFILLPLIARDIRVLMKKHKLYSEERNTLNDIIIPICYIFPCTGKLLTILFVTFAAWYDGVIIDVIQYPEFIITSLLTFIGSANYAIPFLLNHYHISSDLFDIYLMAGVINGKFATLLASVYLFGFTLITTAWLTGFLQINPKKIIKNFSIIIGATILTLIGTKIILNLTPKNNDQVKKMLVSMKIKHPVKTVVKKEYPPMGTLATIFSPKPGLNRLELIKKNAILKVGYNIYGRPFSYFNAENKLVGLDVAMAHMLAKDLNCSLEFIPIKINEIDKYLNSGTVDIVMSGISKTVKRIPLLDFSDSYMLITLALVVKDYRIKEFVKTEDLREMTNLKLAVLKGSSYMETIQHSIQNTKHENKITFIQIENIEDFYKDKIKADALLTSAEQGAAYCMLYPNFETVVPKPIIHHEPIAYVIAKNDLAFSKYLNEWLAIKKAQGDIKKLRNYWIFGKGVEYKQPRWNLWDMIFQNNEKN